jgi:deoxyinosine 3'endonuclease (endonuclease V)
VIFVDGNGVLHPRKCGLACHLGVKLNVPTIGIGKSLYEIDGLTTIKVKQCLREGSSSSLLLCGNSGTVWGAAFQATPNISNPIYISVGHRISLTTAIMLTRQCCRYRIPEPIRQADRISRATLMV